MIYCGLLSLDFWILSFSKRDVFLILSKYILKSSRTYLQILSLLHFNRLDLRIFFVILKNIKNWWCISYTYFSWISFAIRLINLSRIENFIFQSKRIWLCKFYNFFLFFTWFYFIQMLNLCLTSNIFRLNSFNPWLDKSFKWKLIIFFCNNFWGFLIITCRKIIVKLIFLFWRKQVIFY